MHDNRQRTPAAVQSLILASASPTMVGNAVATNSAWSGTCQIVTLCPNTAALYCIEQ